MTVDISDSRERIAEFIDKNPVGVLATVSSTGKAHAAAVYLARDKQLNIYFVTKKETQKSRNLKQNAFAAIAIYDADSQTTVQAEGLTKEVADPRLAESIIKEIWGVALKTSQSHIPPTSRMVAGGYIVFQLSAPSLRMAEFSSQAVDENNNIFETVTTQLSLAR